MVRPAHRAAFLLLAALALPARAEKVRLELLTSGLGGMVHRDWAGGADVVAGLKVSAFRLALAAPLRFDRQGLRRQDWDEPGDFGRILAVASWGAEGEHVFARAGNLPDVTLGAGTLVSHFASTADPDHWRSGVMLSVAYDPAGGDVFLDSFIAPAVLGGRAYLRPLQPVLPQSFAGRIELGATFVGDMSAPHAWRRGQDGTVATVRGGLPDATRTRVLAGGGDLRWPVVKTASVEVAPWAAIDNLEGGRGYHVGLAVNASPGARVRFGLEGAWRRSSAGYVSPWFDGTYEVDRFDAGGRAAAPKAAVREGFRGGRDGLTVGVFLAWATAVSWWVRLDLDRDGRANCLRSGIAAAFWRMRLGATFHERGFQSARDVPRPDRAAFGASAEVAILPTLAWFAAYARDSAVAATGPGRGRYRPSDTALTGLRWAGGM